MKLFTYIFCIALFFTSCSNDINIENSTVVVVTGKLSEQITDDNAFKITHLTISGIISGKDWNILFEMATMGSLEVLDMTNAKIIGKDGWNDDEIPQYQFSGSKTLKEVYLPISLKVIGDEAFFECSKLTQVHFTEGIDSIANRAFYRSGLSGELSLPSHLRVIGPQAFARTKVTKVIVNSDIIAGKRMIQKEDLNGNIYDANVIYTIGGNSQIHSGRLDADA